MSRLRLPPSFLLALVALVSFGLLLLRSRPLERFNAASEALLYASGLNAPRALYSLDDLCAALIVRSPFSDEAGQSPLGGVEARQLGALGRHGV